MIAELGDSVSRIMDLAQQQRPHPERLFHALQQAMGGLVDAHHGHADVPSRLQQVEAALRGEWPPPVPGEPQGEET